MCDQLKPARRQPASPSVRTGRRPAWLIWALALLGGGFGALVVSGVVNMVQNGTVHAHTPAVSPVDHLVLTLAPGVTLSLVHVPAGVFQMGSYITDTAKREDEWFQHPVYLGEYWIGQYEVTNAQYAAFAQATRRPQRATSGGDDYPVINVSWEDALAFSQWASQVTGQPVRLPTEAQWEKAARGPSTGSGQSPSTGASAGSAQSSGDERHFPWGDAEPDATRLNYDLQVKHTTPVWRYSPQGDSPYGAADMVGNVWEWTNSLYWPYPYCARDGREESQSEGLRVLRGGSWLSERNLARVTTRAGSSQIAWGEVMGFRVSMSPPGIETSSTGCQRLGYP